MWRAHTRRSGDAPDNASAWRRQAWWALLVGVVAWSQAIIEQFVSSGRGNLARLIDEKRQLWGAEHVRNCIARGMASEPDWFFGVDAGRTVGTRAAQAAHHLMLGHGLAMAEIRSALPNATAGITLNLYDVDAATPSEVDVDAARRIEEVLREPEVARDLKPTDEQET